MSVAFRKFAAEIGVPESTLNDTIKRENLPFTMEVGASRRGSRPMKHLPPPTVARLLAVHCPTESPTVHAPLREVREVPVRIDDGFPAPVGDPIIAILPMPPIIPILPNERVRVSILCVLALPRFTSRLVAAARSPFAIRAVYTLQVICHALIWFWTPDPIARLFDPRHPETYESQRARPAKLRRIA